MEEFHIRSVKEDDFLKIGEIAPKCPPWLLKEILFTIYSLNSLKTHLLCASPEWRKKGLAKTLIWKFLDIVRIKGCNRNLFNCKTRKFNCD